MWVCVGGVREWACVGGLEEQTIRHTPFYSIQVHVHS